MGPSLDRDADERQRLRTGPLVAAPVGAARTDMDGRGGDTRKHNRKARNVRIRCGIFLDPATPTSRPRATAGTYGVPEGAAVAPCGSALTFALPSSTTMRNFTPSHW